MARVTDYVGRSLGSFEIIRVIDHGAKAEVFACRHKTTGIVYVLRLAATDNDLWAGDPVLPPRNASIERPNAVGTWGMQPAYYELSLKERKGAKDAWVIKTTSIYGILEQRYLVPVASPVRVKGAWDIDALLKKAPPGDLN